MSQSHDEINDRENEDEGKQAEQNQENQKSKDRETYQRRSAAELASLKGNIVASLDIRAFYESRIPRGGKDKPLRFKADGWSEHVRCPIHNDKEGGKPNLSVNVNSGGFKCFSCGKKGSIFDFWCFTNGVDPKVGFHEAIVTLATSVGIDIASHKSYAPRTVDEKVSSGNTFVPKINKAAAANETIPPIPKDTVTKSQEALTPEHYKYLLFSRGLKDAWINRAMIGWDAERKYKNADGHYTKGKFVIPVPCELELIRNIRAYAQDAPSDMKMINTKPYGSPSRLYPLHEYAKLKPQHIIFCEGEWDCILTNQKLDEAGLLVEHGWLAMTNTAGCNTFEPEWMEHFLDKDFYFVFDADKPGKTWAASHANTHFMVPLSSGKLSSLKIVTLPLDGTKDNKDLGDFFVKLGMSLDELLKIIQSTPDCIVANLEASPGDPQAITEGTRSVYSEITTAPIEVSSFVDCIKNREYVDQRVRVPVTISGECTKIYHATRSMRVTNCPLMRDDQCCASGAGIQTIPYGDVSFIECCMANKKGTMATLQSLACTKGKPCTIEEVEKVVMQEFFGHQVVKRLTVEPDENGRMINSQQLVTTSLYILQPERHVDVGPHDYLVTGYVRSHPQSRQATLFVEQMEPLEEDWMKFEVNEETKPHLKLFQDFPNVKKLLDELTAGVTQIHESNDILLTVLLTYMSPLWISFNGKAIRGWINSCIIGDSGTGKTATYLRISDWAGIGDVFSALSGTRTGLLYSIKQKGNEWYVQIGRYVIASGKIIAVDEAQMLDPVEVSSMAKAMDEGWLEVSRVASGGYQTCTRTIFLMNPTPPKKISDFAYGCQAMAEVFPAPMFIRRIDLAVFSTGKEDIEFYNQRYNKQAAQEISVTPEAFRSLVYWAWTRTLNDIHWTEDATNKCLEKATELSKVFGQADDVPLVCPQDFRDTLARISTSFAILSGSFTEDYTGVNVLPEHVEKMAKFVDVLYSSSACNLRQYSKGTGRKKTLKDFETIVEVFTKIIEDAKHSNDPRWSQGQHFLQLILLMQQQQYVRKRDLAEQLGVSLGWVQQHVSVLQAYNLVEAYRGGTKTTRKFNLFMQRWQSDGEVEKMLEEVNEKIGKLAMLMRPDTNDYAYNQDDPFMDT